MLPLPLPLTQLFSVWISIATVVQCATICLHAQPRSEGAPSNGTISQALHSILATSDHGPCSEKFPTLPNGSPGNYIQRSTASLVLGITRADSSIEINNHECIQAFNGIIYKCVRQGIFWGGNATSPGVNYAIYNDAYPSNWKLTASAASHHSSLPPLHVSLVPSHITADQGGKSTLKPVVRSSLSSSKKNRVPNLGIGTLQNQQSTRRSKSIPKSPTSAGATRITPSSTIRRSPTSGSVNTTKTDVPYGVAGALGAAGGLVAVGAAAVGIAGARSPEPYVAPTHTSSHSYSITQQSSSSTSHSSSRSQSSSSPTASSSSIVYLIYPKDGFNTANNNVVTDKLRSIAGNKLAINENSLLGLYFWAAPLTPEEKREILSLSAVVSRQIGLS